MKSANGLFIAGIVILSIGGVLALITGLIHWSAFCRGHQPGSGNHSMEDGHGSYPMQQMPPPTASYGPPQQGTYHHGHPVPSGGQASVYPPPPHAGQMPGYGPSSYGYQGATYAGGASAYPTAQPIPGGVPSHYANQQQPVGANNYYPHPQHQQGIAQVKYPEYPQYPQP